MTWPTNCIHGVDLSANQETLDIDKFVKANPDVKRYVLRAYNAFGRIDARLEAFSRGVPEYDLYVWPDPINTLTNMRLKWLGFAGLQPKTVWLDVEWSAAKWQEMTGKKPIRSITDDTRESLRILTDIFPDVGIYCNGNRWGEMIREHGWERDYKFWVAHYPTPFQVKPNEWRQCATFEECSIAVLGTSRYAKFPGLGEWIPPENVVGWQFSEKGRLPGYGRDIDLDLWKGPPKPTLEQRVVALEATAHSH